MDEIVLRLSNQEYRLVCEDCPCGQRAAEPLISQIDRYGLPLDSVICLACGTVRFDPYLDAPSLDHFYREMYTELYGRATNHEAYFDRQRIYGRKLADWSLACGGRGALRVLEIGCGSGGALSVFQERGCEAMGCDFDTQLLGFGTARGVRNLHCGPVDDIVARYGEGSFDLIYMHHVFEHVGEPLATLKATKRLLADNGVLLIIVPEIEFVDRYPNPGGDVLQFLHIAHKYNYSIDGLGLLAAQAGLEGSRVQFAGDLATPWSNMPELSMAFQSTRNPSTAAPTASHSRSGARALTRLRRTEWQYQWGFCPVQLQDQWQKVRPWLRWPRRAA